MPAARFDEALAGLRAWYEEVTGEAPEEQGRLFRNASVARRWEAQIGLRGWYEELSGSG